MPRGVDHGALGDRIGTSPLFAAWNAAIYVNQIEMARSAQAVHREVDADEDLQNAHHDIRSSGDSAERQARYAGKVCRDLAAHLLEHGEALANQFALRNSSRMA